MISRVKIGSRLGHNDRKEIEFAISVDRRKNASKTSALNMRRGDFRLFRELISNVPWENVFAGAGVHQFWSHSKLHLLQAQDQAIPKCQKKKQVRQKDILAIQESPLGNKGKMEVYALWKQGW